MLLVLSSDTKHILSYDNGGSRSSLLSKAFSQTPHRPIQQLALQPLSHHLVALCMPLLRLLFLLKGFLAIFSFQDKKKYSIM